MIISAALLIAAAVALLPWARGHQAGVAMMKGLGALTYRCLPTPLCVKLDTAALLTQYPKTSLQGWIGCLNAALAAVVAGFALNLNLLLWAGGAMLVVSLLKLMAVYRAGRARLQSIVNALPAQLDLLAMLLAAGQPLLSSLQRSSDGLLQNPLRQELRAMVASIRAGETMESALQRFARVFDAREIRLFCGALNHARESGASLADILREQARHRRNELFLQAEQKALEAPVKLMLPLLTCIFPTALILLIVVLSAKLMWQL